MRYLKRNFATLFVLAAVMFVSCSPKVKTQVLMPAEVNLSEYKTVGVADFEEADGDWGRKIASWLENELIEAKVDGKPYFNVLPRAKIDQTLKEHDLPMTSLTDPKIVSQLGQLAGLDAIITGMVHSASNQEQIYSLRRPCALLTGHLDLSVQFISTTTGRVVVDTKITQQKVEDSCGLGSPGLVELNYLKEPLSSLAREVVKEFVRKITPHHATLEFTLKKKDDSPGGSSRKVTKLLAMGSKYAENGDWDSALEKFRQAVDLKHDSPAANYDLAVAFEVKGELHKAKEYYQTALLLNSETDYSKGVANIKDRLASQEKLEQQLH
jgi:TPR repeat